MTSQLFLTLTTLLSSPETPTSNVLAEFSGFTNDTVVLWTLPLTEQAFGNEAEAMRRDTLLLTNGKLRTAVETRTPVQCMLIPQQLTDQRGDPLPSSFIHFVLDKGEQIRIKGVMQKGWVRTSVKGSALNRDLSEFYNTSNPDAALLGELQTRLEFEPQAATDTLLRKSYRTCVGKVRANMENYIATHLDRPAAGLILIRSGGAVIQEYFQKLTPEVRNSVFKPLLDKLDRALQGEQLRKSAQERIQIGAEAPDFSLKTSDRTDFTLSQLRGKYVVLDFWGSWCGWCIKGFPELKTCYAKYKGLFEVVGIACNDSQQKWLAAIDEYRLPWMNVINPRGADAADDVAIRYGISAYPTKIIIDPAGRIADIFVGEKPGFAETMDRLLRGN